MARSIGISSVRRGCLAGGFLQRESRLRGGLAQANGSVVPLLLERQFSEGWDISPRTIELRRRRPGGYV
jgi:hypothetical protein